MVNTSVVNRWSVEGAHAVSDHSPTTVLGSQHEVLAERLLVIALILDRPSNGHYDGRLVLSDHT